MRGTLRTSELAKAAGIHPNTVRLYEALGFLPKAERGANGYRLFTERHREQVLLVRSLTRCSWLGGAIHKTAQSAIMRSAAGDLAGARADGAAVLQMVVDERSRAELAVAQLEEWVAGGGSLPVITGEGMNIKAAAAFLAVTPDTLRNWDRNELLRVPRDRSSGYRIYGDAELRRLMVIRALRRARYSVMSIFYMFQRLEADKGADPRTEIDALRPGEEDVFYSTDRWLTRVKEIEVSAREAVDRLAKMP